MSAEAAFLFMGLVAGACGMWAGIVIGHYLAERRSERVELDEAWVRFNSRRIP